MPRFRTRSVLSRAAFGAIHGAGIYYAKAKPDTVAGGGGGESEDEPDEPAKLEMTEQELTDRIEAAKTEAVKAALDEAKKKARQKKRKQDEEDEPEEEEEDPHELVRTAELELAKARQEAADAKRESMLARVENKLQNYLALNHKEFLGNAPDIMLHIEKALSAEAKDAEIARVIESNCKAFVDRTKAARSPSAVGVNASRSKLIGQSQQQTHERETRTITRTEQEARPRFSTLNWHG